MSNKFKDGTIVISPTYGKGVIKKIITASTGYAEIKFDNGQTKKLLKKFANLTYEDGTPCYKPTQKTINKNEIRSKMTKGEKKREKDRIALENFSKLTPLKQLQERLCYINGVVYGDIHSLSYQMWSDLMHKIEPNKDSFAHKIWDSVFKYQKASDKQAYILAKWYIDNVKKEIPKDESYIKNTTNNSFLKGKEIQISMPNGEKRKAQFVVADIDNIIASHNEESFTTSKDYPTNADGSNINDRNYKDDKNAQLLVQSFAKGLEPERIITTSRTPSGTPIINEQGIVVSGNNRTMSLKLAKNHYPENYKEYKTFLLEEAEAFGIDTNDIIDIIQNGKVLDKEKSELTFNGEKKYINIKNPVLVRIDYDIKELSTEELSKYNKDTKKSESPIDKAIKLSHILLSKPNCIEIIANTIGDVETFSEFYAKVNPQKALLKNFIDCGLILEQEIPMYFDGVFNQNGKEFIEQTLASAILNRESLLLTELAGVKKLRQIIITSLPVLIANKQLPNNADLTNNINNAIKFQYNLATGNFEFQDMLKQTTMFSVINYSYKDAVINRLLNSGRNNFKKAISDYNKAVINEQAGSMFGDAKSNSEIFETIIANRIDTQDLAFIMASENISEKPKQADNSLNLVANNDVAELQQMVAELVKKYNDK